MWLPAKMLGFRCCEMMTIAAISSPLHRDAIDVAAAGITMQKLKVDIIFFRILSFYLYMAEIGLDQKYFLISFLEVIFVEKNVKNCNWLENQCLN